MRTRQDVMNVVRKHLLDIVEDLSEDDIDPSQSMVDMGANSLDLVEIVSSSMRELRVKVPRSELGRLKNMNQLVDLLWGVVQAQTSTLDARTGS